MSSKVKTPVKKLIETRIREYNNGETTFAISMDNSNVRVNVGHSSYVVSFSITEYHYCCGFREIGNIIINKGLVELTESLERDLLTKFLRKVTNQFVDTDVNTRIGLSFTIPINQPTEGFYDRFIEASLKVGFREVAEFTNRNSNNLLKHFIFT